MIRHLTWLGALVILTLTLAACNPFADDADDWPHAETVVPPADARGDFPVIVIIGDSIAAGWGDCATETCAGIARHWWQDAIGAQGYVFNRGIGDSTTGDILEHWTRDTAEADILFIMSGVNDLARGAPPERILTNFETIRARALDAGMVPVFSTIMPAETTQGAALSAMRAINTELRGLSAAGWWVIDLSAHMQDPANPGYLAPDWLAAPGSAHPSPAGYARMTDFLRAWWAENEADLIAAWRGQSSAP
ncbi:MAG: SGNH/GDSL hydrolase family protein [Anaerolineales bacterium]